MRPHNAFRIGFSSLRATTSKSRKVFTTKLKAFFPNTRTRVVALIVFLALTCAAFYSTSSASPLGMLLRGYMSGRAPAVKTGGAKTGGAKVAPAAVRKTLPAASAKPQQAANEPILESGNLNIERRGHTATKLAGGRILIVGGENEGGLVKKSEIFDPGSRQFSFAARLKAPRTEHTATTLPDGRVLVVGGRGREGSLGSSEIFDPATESFSRGPSLNLARAGHTAAELADGRVLLVGGDAQGSAEIFDPSTNRFSLIEAHLGSPRSSHSAVLLKSGKVLIAGGLAEDRSTVQSGEIFDPETMQFSATGNMRGLRTRPTLRVLPDGKVQVIGGDQERTMEMFNAEGEYFTAYGHITPESSSLLEILRAGTRAALIHEVIPGDVKLQSMTPSLDELLDRSDHTLTDMPESGTAVVVGGKKGKGKVLKSVGILSSSGATVTTDKTDYAPGETVIITGAGWQAGETVGLRIHRDGHDPSTDTLLSAVADASGNIQNSEFVIQESDLGVTFLLTATGQSSGFTGQTTFTDGAIKISAAPSGITFTLKYRIYPGTNPSPDTNCSDPSDAEVTVLGISSAQHNIGVGNNDGIRLEAAALSDQGTSFINWSSPNGSAFSIVGGNPRIICVGADSTSKREYVANYAACALTCPANKTAKTSDDGTGNCSTTVTYTAPTTGGTCGTVTCSPASSSVFPKGTTTVTCTSASTGATCSFTVTVNDDEKPTANCPANIVTNTDPNQCQAVVNYTATASDNCPGSTISCTPASGTAFPKGTTTVNCTATDTSGNTANCSFTVTVNDNQAPTANCPANIVTNTDPNQCSAVVNYTATANDNCPGSTISCTPGSGSTFPKGTATVTCTATDASGNTSTPCTFTVTVNDNQAPTASCPANIVTNTAPNQCSAVVIYTATAIDNCPGSTISCTPASGSTFPKGTTTVNCTATDASGNTANCSFAVTVNDNQAPTATCPANIVTNTDPDQCQAVVNYTATASDNCPDPTIICTPASGTAFPKGTTTVNCTATDTSGNTANCSFTVTVNDNQAPTANCPANVVTNTDPGQCSSVVIYTATASDNCPGSTISCSPTSGTTFPKGTTTVTCTATDSSTNIGSCKFTVTVEDKENPTITCPANTTVQCDADVPTPAADRAAFLAAGGTASDNCDPPPTVAFVGDEASGSCPKIITRTYKATDSSGNEATCTQTITVNDTTKPVLTGCPADASFQCYSQVPAPANVTANDNCDGPITPTFTETQSNQGSSCNNTITRTWTATDRCGNSSSCTQTITVNDTTRPEITCPNPVIVQCASQVPAPDPSSVTASDNCGTVTVTHDGDVISNQTCPNRYTITRTYKATDPCGNSSSCTQIITVNDTTKPVLSGCPTDASFQCYSQVPGPASVTATDNCDGTVTPTFNETQSNPGSSCHNTITRTWTATDRCNNVSTCTQIITVDDTTAPVLSGCPVDNPTVQCVADVPARANVTANDNCDGAIDPSFIEVESNPGSSCHNTITRTWTATDSCGNFSTCTQTITVDDTTAPVLSGCPTDASFQCISQVPPAANVTANDNCDGAVTPIFSEIQSNPGSSCHNTITRTWTATDRCGNFSTCTQIITVNDTTKPVLSGCPTDASFQCISQVPAPANVTANDNCDGAITPIVSETQSNPGSSCNNTITRTWTAADRCGNSSSCTQTITVNDTTRPEISCPAAVTVQCASQVPATDFAGGSASDNCGTVTVTHDGDVISNQTCANRYTITRTYKATDACGNTATCTQTITVNDTNAPVLSGCPADASFQCLSQVPQPASVTAIDNCDGAITPIFSETQSKPGSSCNNIITRTWTATDRCGNSSRCTQTITVNDTTPPTFVSCPTNITVMTNPGQPAVVNFTSAAATDNCDPNPTVTCTPPPNSTFPVGITTVTCTATDACGNTTPSTSTCNFQVIVPACITKVIVEANYTKKGSITAKKEPVVGARVIMASKARVQARCNLLDATCVWMPTNKPFITNDPDMFTGADGSVVVYSSVPDPNGWAIYIDMQGAKASTAFITLGTTKIAVANTDCAPTKRFTAILVADSTGTNATAMTQRQQQITGSLLEITYAEQVEWDGTDFLYPFIFTSDSDWEVDVCASVPQGYRIRGNPCEQLFVANETKVIFFDVEDIGSPEPRLQVRLKVKHQGKIKDLDLDIPGVRKKNKK